MSEDKGNAYFRVIDISKTPIYIQEGICRAKIKNLDKITDIQIPYLSTFCTPILLSHDGARFELVGRSWCYELQVARNITKILFYIDNGKSSFLEYFRKKIEPKENAAVEFIIASLIKLTSKGTIARHKAIAAHRQCIFCHDALMSPLGTPKPDAKGLFRVHCYNSKQGRCDFFLPITASELPRFKGYNFNINDFLILIPNEKCPKCGGQLYLRVMLMPNSTLAYYKCCRNKFSTKNPCTYAIKLEGAPTWLGK